MDLKSKIKITDNKLINVDENFEIENWSERFGVAKERLKQAINAVGNSAEEVEKYLDKNQ